MNLQPTYEMHDAFSNKTRDSKKHKVRTILST